jgi:hypothetical protein
MKKGQPKPQLTVVGTAPTGIQPPRPLGKHGNKLWLAIQREYKIDVGGIERLAQICGAVDRLEVLAEEIARDGVVIRTRSGTVRSHPGVRDEIALRSFICRTLARLGISSEPLQALGRPPLQWSPSCSVPR